MRLSNSIKSLLYIIAKLYVQDKVQKFRQNLKNKRPTWCHLLFYFTSYVLNMFRTLIYPSSGACDCAVELPHVVLFLVRCVLKIWCGRTKSSTHNEPRTKRHVVIQQHSRKLLMMDISMSETCSAHKKWNKIASDIKLVFYSSNSVWISELCPVHTIWLWYTVVTLWNCSTSFAHFGLFILHTDGFRRLHLRHRYCLTKLPQLTRWSR